MGQFLDRMMIKNPRAQNIIYESYSIAPTNLYFLHRFNYVKNLYKEKNAKYVFFFFNYLPKKPYL